MTGANWAVTNAVTSVVTSASRHENRLTHCNCLRLLLSPMSPIETPETLENAKQKEKTTHDASIHPELHLARPGGRDAGLRDIRDRSAASARPLRRLLRRDGARLVGNRNQMKCRPGIVRGSLAADPSPTARWGSTARWCGYGSSGSPRAPRCPPRRERPAGRQWAWSVPCLSG